MEGIFNKVPLLTILTFVSYITYFSYKAGEAVFFGNPISLIQVDFSTLIFTLLRVSVILLGLSFIVWFFIATDSKFVDSTRMSVIAIILMNAFFWVTGKGFNLKSLLVSIAVYVLVYGFCHFTRDIISGVGEVKDKKYSILGFSLCLIIISFLIGNYFGPYFQMLKDTESNVVISEYKDGFLTMKCHPDFSKTFAVLDLKSKVLKDVDVNYLVRKNLVGECNSALKYE